MESAFYWYKEAENDVRGNNKAIRKKGKHKGGTDQDYTKKQGAVAGRNSWEATTVRPSGLYALSNERRKKIK